jgi:hypothetical protein
MKSIVFRNVFAVALLSSIAFAAVPSSNHVYIVLEENHSYESVIGNPTMPYFNSLAQKYGLATQYYANSHYSIPNYMWLTAGDYVTMNDNTKAMFNVDNIVPHLLSAGRTWKEYAESLPYAGYTGYNVGNYVKRHNPFPYFTNVANSSEKNNIVPFTQLASDIANHTLPNYGFITPNLLDDAHNGTLAAADKWLQENIAPLINSSEFQSDGILIITWDESFDSDCRPATSCPPLPENKGGGRIATLVIGPDVKPGYRSTTFYQHPSALKTMAEALGITTFPGAAESASDMAEFFSSTKSAPALNAALTISPGQATVAAGGAVAYQVAIMATSGAITDITFSCADLPQDFACSFSPAVLSPGDAQAATTLTVSTGHISAASNHSWLPVVFAIVGFCCPGIVLAGRTPKPRLAAVLLPLAIALGVSLQACGGTAAGNPAANGPGTYRITVNAASGSHQTSATTELIVR